MMVLGRLVWMNGEFVELKSAKVPFMTATLHYGVGVFEGIAAYPKNRNLCIFRLGDHVERLFQSAKVYDVRLPFSKEDICRGVKETFKVNDFHKRCYVRLLAYKGELSEFGVKQSYNTPTEVAILASSKDSFVGTQEFEKGKSAIISSWRRISPDVMPATAKCVANYANSALGLMEARERKADYVVFLDTRGFLSEGFAQNIFVVNKGRLMTPPTFASILMGITRDTVIRLARDLGYEILEKDITRSELHTSEEIFLCGTAAEIAPIVSVDGMQISESAGEVTRKIASRYGKLVTGNLPGYEDWLTLI